VGRTERQSESATEVAGAYTVRGSLLEAGAATSFSHREAYEAVLLGGGGVKNWRPDFQARHRRYAELRAMFGPPLLIHPLHGDVSPEPDRGFGGDSPRYKDFHDSRFLVGTPELQKKCPGHFLIGSCENGHRYAKELYCDREWCPECGEKWSEAHQRRYSRLLPKAQQLKVMGYFVIEWPLKSRGKLRRKRALARAGITIRAVLSGKWEINQRRRRGERISKDQELQIRAGWFPRGITRWHYFGDVAREIREDLKCLTWGGEPPETYQDGQGRRYNPHQNVLVAYPFIVPGKLERIKRSLRAALGEPDLIVHYGFTKEPAVMVHVLKYVTRATFRDWMWAPEVAADLYKFHNVRSWGRWADLKKNPEAAVWSSDDLEGEPELKFQHVVDLESGICPRCGKPLSWAGPYPIGALKGMDSIPLGAGYYELPAERAPPGMHLVMMLRKAGYDGPVEFLNE